MLVLVNIEPRQPQNGRDGIQHADAPQQPPLKHVAVSEHDENRRHAKCDHVAQAVQLLAELACLPRHSRNVTVQHVEHHPQEDQQRRVKRQVKLRVVGDVTGHHRDRGQPAYPVGQRTGRRQSRKRDVANLAAAFFFVVHWLNLCFPRESLAA